MKNLIGLDLKYDFFTLEEIYEFYNKLEIGYSNPNNKVGLISFLLEFKILEDFVKTQNIVFFNRKVLGDKNHLDIYLNQETKLNLYNYTFFNLDKIYENFSDKSITDLINNTFFKIPESLNSYKLICLKDAIIKFDDKKELITKIFTEFDRRYNIQDLISIKCNNTLLDNRNDFLKNLNNIKKLFNIKHDYELIKIKKIQTIFFDTYFYVQKNPRNYDFLEEKNLDINLVFPYVLQKSIYVKKDLFDKLNEKNKILATIYMLEENTSDKFYLQVLKETLKNNESFYRDLITSKKLITLIDKYTRKQEIDISKYFKFKNSVSFHFSKKDIRDLMPEMNSDNLISFYKRIPSITDKLNCMSYNGIYIITYNTNENFTNEEFIKFFIENIEGWVKTNSSFETIEKEIDKKLRENNLREIIDKSDKKDLDKPKKKI